MRNSGIEKSLRNAVNSTPMIPFEELVGQSFLKMTEHDYITKQVQEKRRSSRFIRYALSAACCLLILVSVMGWYTRNVSADSIITLDVNPSIQIITDHKNHVLSVVALNEDAKAILENYDYKGSTLEDTVAALMNSLVKQEYINTDKSAILLTVMNKNNGKAKDILEKTALTICESLQAQNITPTLIKQVISKEEVRAELSDLYHISEGKMKLIQEMVSLNDRFTLTMLADMTIQQLLNLADENSIDLSNYLSEGEEISNPVTEAAIPNEIIHEDETSKEDSKEKEDQEDDYENDNNNRDNQTREDSEENNDENNNKQTEDGLKEDNQGREEENEDNQSKEIQEDEGQGDKEQEDEGQEDEGQGDEGLSSEEQNGEEQSAEGQRADNQSNKGQGEQDQKSEE